MAERERAEEALAQEQFLMRTLMSFTPDFIYFKDRDSRFIRISKALAQLFGLSDPAQAVGKTDFDFFTQEHARQAYEDEQAVIRMGQPLTKEERETWADRPDTWVSTTKVPLHDEAGNAVGTFGISRDITEHKRAEAELRRLNRLYRVLSRANQMILRARDPQQVFEEACRIAVEDGAFQMAWVGVVDETVRVMRPVVAYGDVGNYLDGITVSADDSPEGRGPGGTAFREGRSVVSRDIEHDAHMAPWRDKALALGYRACGAFPLRTADRVVGGFHVYAGEVGGFTDAEVHVLDELAGDISYALDHLEGESLRKRAEEALRTSETKYRSLVEHAVYGIYRSTLDGRFVAVNPGLVEMLGYGSEAEMLALDLARDLYADPEERGRLVARDHNVERVQGVEVVWKRKDGKPITVRLSGRPLRDETFDGFEMVVEDLTERRVLEDQLRQAQKMEAVGQLAGGVAHDFNNLLTAVLTSADLLRSALPADSPLVEDVDTISSAAQRGAELTRKLLAFSRRQPLELRTLSLGGLAEAFTRMARRVVPEDVEVVLRVEAPDATVQADQGAVEQILMNLVTNARDAMPTGGKLLIEVRRSTLDEAYRQVHGWGEPGEYVTLVVSDTGVGMDAETQRHIFEPFFTSKPAGQGTGLGMSTVYGLVKQQQGFVHVYSELGQGTTVRVYFPAVTGEGAEIVEQATPEVRGGTETILLVEDNEAVRRAGTRVLQKFGYKVLTAADGGEALEIMQSGAPAPDLIISDVVMPRTSGPQLLRQLREAGPVPKVLFTSGYTARDVHERTTLEPGMPFLAKPWTLTDLLRKVREVLDGPAIT